MNERIRELADEIFSMEEFEYAEEFLDEEFIKKFAELIVKECAELCLKHAEYEGPFHQMEFRKGQHFNTIIKNHFGVKE